MKKKMLCSKVIAGALVTALAASGIPHQVQAASYPASSSELLSATWRSEKHVSVHDPSIVLAYEDAQGNTYPENAEGRKKVYYIFGSHLAWAKSYDLQSWKTFENNINRQQAPTIFKEDAEWSGDGDPDYSLFDGATNLWAPDVIWNKDMGKWCMYMSINGHSWNSSIVLLTADKLDGNWTKVGTVVYSGFTNGDVNSYKKTDFEKVMGSEQAALKQISKGGPYYGNPWTFASGSAATTWNIQYGAHAIDPCVLYDNGKLYMTYGSWSGGIYMLELDEKTGLRDYSVTYKTVENQSDQYMGLKLGGGYQSSGEASYIQKIGDYYYLFITNGGLTANGGYNMRVFRSDAITGPYVDEQGNSAIYTKSVSNIQNNIGSRLMSYCKWSWMIYGEVAQGHNSAFVDDDGKAYLIYHTRSNEYGEVHEVRTHQLFQNENGWLMAAPFEYAGETIRKEGYGIDEIAGTYEVILHGATNYKGLEVNNGVDIELLEDGTIICDSSDYEGGTWDQKDGTCYLTMKLDGITYHGVFTTGVMEGMGEETMCFTAVADQPDVGASQARQIWGAKQSSALTQYLQSKLELTDTKVSLKVGKTKKLKVYNNLTQGNYKKNVVWSSSKKKVATVSKSGKITAKKAGTATIKAKVAEKTFTCKVTVKKVKNKKK